MRRPLVPPLRQPRFLRRAAAVALLALAANGRAELQWETKEQPLVLRATESAGAVRFAFVNSGAKPVTITDVHPGCGCTVPSLEKYTYDPGERGELKVVFHPGNREGTVHMPVTVQTDATADTVTLTLVAQIKTIVAFDTRFVFWKNGEARTPKVMRLTFAEDLATELADVKCDKPQFTASFRPVDGSAHEYEITVTPPANVQDYTAITVRTLIGAEKSERNFTVVARTM